MAASDDENKRSKKSGGFFDFLFNTSKFVETLTEEQLADSSTQVQAQAVESDLAPVVEPIFDDTPSLNLLDTTSEQTGPAVEEEVSDFSPPAEGSDLAGIEIDINTPEGFKRYLSGFTYYQLLQADRHADSRQLKIAFRRRIRKLLRSSSETMQLNDWQFKELVLMVNVANQVLQDEKARAVYDKELSSPNCGAPERNQSKNASRNGKVIEVLELVRMFKMLGPTTKSQLEALCSREKGKSDRELTGVLVEQGLLSEEQMESMILASYLLASGKVTMSQLELVMDEIATTESPLWVSLVAKGWVKMSDVT